MPLSFTAHCKPGDEPHALFLISREHYVGARLAFVGDAPFPAQLLLHQCIETSAKALLKFKSPARQFKGASGHRLHAFLEELAPERPEIRHILDDADTRRVLDVLNNGYNQIRYGEGILGFSPTGALRAFDNIALRLLGEVGRALGYGTILSLRVRRRALPLFLWELHVPLRCVERPAASHDDSDDPWESSEVHIEPPALLGTQR